MDRLRQMLENISNLDEGKILFNTLKENELADYILDLNKLQIFRDSEDYKGNDIFSNSRNSGSYSEVTEEFLRGESFTFGGITKQKTAGDPYFLYDSGDYFKTFKIKLDVDGDFTISSNPTDFTDGEYGELEGLTFNSIDELIEKITPIYQKKTREFILA